ncbi:MAG: hypothetical protein GY805_03800 [Chloroflexi bacterium]|nr:hypothetical protein [Chloroflexota bacterium]
MQDFCCLTVRRSVVQQINDEGETAHSHKLIQVDERLDEFFDLSRDPTESENLLAKRPFVNPCKKK